MRHADPTVELSAKIKRVFLELHDYVFFHNPSEVGDIDQRFIGRLALINRLRTILMNHETKSGAYLVTGYRGAGKSSVVAKALSDVRSGATRNSRAPRLFRIALALPVLALFDASNARGPSSWLESGRSAASRFPTVLALPALALAAAALYLLWKDRQRDPRTSPQQGARWRERGKQALTALLGTLAGLVGFARVDPRELEGALSWLCQGLFYACQFPDVLVAAPSLGMLSIGSYLVWRDRQRDQLKLRRRLTFRERGADVVQRVMNTFYVDTTRSPELRLRRLAQDVYLTTLLHLLAVALICSFHTLNRSTTTSFTSRLAFYGAAFAWFALLTALLSERRHLRRRVDLDVKPSSWWGMRLIRTYVNFSHRVHIHLNLGKDGLSEIDVLRLISSAILTRYVQFKRSITTDLLWRPVRVGLLFLTIALIYFYPPIYRLNQGLKLESHLPRYFPSQSAFLMSEGAQGLEKILKKHVDSRTVGPILDPADLLRELDAALCEDLRSRSPFTPLPVTGIGRESAYAAAHADLIVHSAYRRIRDMLPVTEASLLWSRAGFPSLPELVGAPRVSPEFALLPAQLDYLYLFYVAVWGLLVRKLAQRQPFGIVSHALILRKLRELNDRIEAAITIEQGAAMGGLARGLSFSRSYNRRKSVPIATTRDIEKLLLEVLKDIDSLPWMTAHPAFIFVFDELDKIEPHQNLTITEAEDSEGVPRGDSAASPYEAARDRQHRILSLFSNLKHFFTTAKAKFIFIAGREMFDASLADVSDRHSFMGSIFNEVLYVPSFLRDPSDSRLGEATSLTERYVCQFLIPPEKDWEPNLHSYERYLRDFFFPERDSDPPWERRLARQKRDKIIADLQALIAYLTYRSNGAPKKLTALFEEHVRRIHADKLRAPDALTVGRSPWNLYIELGFYEQYTFGLVSRLAIPLFYSLNQSIKDFNDKLLVSSSFVLDHIYKFHGFGFSWRNLELIPEIVDINRAPELRSLVTDIVRFLLQTHLEDIGSGLYDFKFRKEIVEEIAFLSKVSEREAAAFNFTLDESLPLKRHYHRRLRSLRAEARNGKADSADSYRHSVGFVQMILGDLHFYDEDYDHAILEYMEGVQAFQGETPVRSLHRLLVLMRNYLKLGMAFERKRTFESAFATYSRLERVVAELAPVALAAKEPGEGSPGAAKPDGQQGGADAAKGETLPDLKALEALRLIWQPMVARLHVIEKAHLCGITRSDLDHTSSELSSLCGRMTPERSAAVSREFNKRVGDILYYKNGTLPEVRERGKPRSDSGGPGGAAPPRTEVKRETTTSVQVPGASRLYCESGAALCLRNDHARALFADGCSLPCAACSHYMQSLAAASERLPPLSTTKPRHLAYGLMEALSSGRVGRYRGIPGSDLREVATALSNSGDTFLACTAPPAFPGSGPSLRGDFVRSVLGAIAPVHAKDPLDRRQLTESESKLEEAVLYYSLAARFYALAGDRRGEWFQLTKILYVIREYLSCEARSSRRKWLTPDLVVSIETHLLSRGIRCVYRAYGNTHRLEIEKFQEVLERREVATESFQLEGSRYQHAFVNLLSMVSLGSEIKEMMVLWSEIQESCGGRPAASRATTEGATDGDIARTDAGVEGVRWSYRAVSPYGRVTSVYGRIHELRCRGGANYHTLVSLGPPEAGGGGPSGGDVGAWAAQDSARLLACEWARNGQPWSELWGEDASEGREDRGSQLLEFLISDSLFCFHEIVRDLRIYGLSYMANHSMRAAAHEKLAWWCDVLYAYIKTLGGGTNVAGRHASERITRLERRVRSLVGEAFMVALTPNYHREMAIAHYEAALETHSDGKAYREIIDRMYYLNDDFNDPLTHFCAGVERYRIRAKARKRIDALTRALGKMGAGGRTGNDVYSPGNYYGVSPEVSDASERRGERGGGPFESRTPARGGRDVAPTPASATVSRVAAERLPGEGAIAGGGADSGASLSPAALPSVAAWLGDANGPQQALVSQRSTLWIGISPQWAERLAGAFPGREVRLMLVLRGFDVVVDPDVREVVLEAGRETTIAFQVEPLRPEGVAVTTVSVFLAASMSLLARYEIQLPVVSDEQSEPASA